MLLYRINEKDRTVSIVWSINKNELLSASEKEKVYTFDDILSQLEDFRNNRSKIFENLRITLMNGLNERIKVKDIVKTLKPTVLENNDNIFFKYYSNLLTAAYMNIGEPILMPKDYVKEKFNHKKLVEQARTELQKQFDEVLQAMNDERNFDYSATGEMLVATPKLQLAVIRTENTNSVYRVADKPLLTFFYEFSFAIFEAGLKGLLLYAKTEEEVFPDGEPFVIGGNSIGARTLDLNKDFEEIACQLDNIAENIFPKGG